MALELKKSINRFYYDMTISELYLMNCKSDFPSITYNSLLYMDIIAYKGKCTVSFLAEALNINKSAVTVKVKELCEQGLLIKTQSEEDKRVFYIEVNEKYRDECNLYDKRINNAIEDIKTNFLEDEIKTFCTVLDRLSNNYSKVIEKE